MTFGKVLGILLLIVASPVVVAAIAENRGTIERWTKEQSGKLRRAVGRVRKANELRRAVRHASEM
jgi:hypothetical protein